MKRRQQLPSLVKEVDLTSAYPGYRYKYFSSFAEVDEYFRREVGEDWLDQEWAVFWLRDHWKTEKREQRERNATARMPKSTEEQTRTPKELILALINYYRRNHGMSLRQVAKALKEHDGINLSYSAISKLLKRHGDSVYKD